MRKFTLIASSMLLSLAAAAAPVSLNRHHAAKVLKHAEPTEAEAARMGQLKAAGTMALSTVADRHDSTRKLRKAPGSARVVAPTDEIIDETPAGTLTNWSRDCLGYYSFFGYVISEPVQGCIQQMVEADSKTVYLNIQASQFPLDTWVKAEKGADGSLTIQAGQKVYQEDYEDELYDFCMVPVTFEYVEGEDEYEEGDYEFTYHDSIKFVLVDGRYEQEDPDVIFGLCEYDPEAEEYYWTGYGDAEIVFSPLNSNIVELPAGLTAEKWAAVTDDGGYFVNVAFSGSKVYVGGLLYTAPEGYIEGELSQDGKTITFKGGQFQGATEDWTWAFIYGGSVEEVWDDYWEEYVNVATISGDLHFTYDAEAKSMTSVESVVVTSNTSDKLDEINPTAFIAEITIELQHRNPDAVPVTPTDLSFIDEFEDYGDNQFLFTIPEVDVDGNLLDSENLYYRIYVDGEVFTFFDDEYYGVPADGTELIQANFSNFDNIYASGIYKCVYLFMDGIDEVGVQSVYMQPVEGGEPKELCSEVATISTSGIASVTAGNDVRSSEYFDLQGRRTAAAQGGLYIRRDVMTDGSVKAVKVIVK